MDSHHSVRMYASVHWNIKRPVTQSRQKASIQKELLKALWMRLLFSYPKIHTTISSRLIEIPLPSKKAFTEENNVTLCDRIRIKLLEIMEPILQRPYFNVRLIYFLYINWRKNTMGTASNVSLFLCYNGSIVYRTRSLVQHILVRQIG